MGKHWVSIGEKEGKRQAPCESCEHKDINKLKPFNWFDTEFGKKRMPRDENGTINSIPGRNYPNPCYGCEKAGGYAIFIGELYDFPPVNIKKEGLSEPHRLLTNSSDFLYNGPVVCQWTHATRWT